MADAAGPRLIGTWADAFGSTWAIWQHQGRYHELNHEGGRIDYAVGGRVYVSKTYGVSWVDNPDTAGTVAYRDLPEWLQQAARAWLVEVGL